jgi:hypothetical protein
MRFESHSSCVDGAQLNNDGMRFAAFYFTGAGRTAQSAPEGGPVAFAARSVTGPRRDWTLDEGIHSVRTGCVDQAETASDRAPEGHFAMCTDGTTRAKEAPTAAGIIVREKPATSSAWFSPR